MITGTRHVMFSGSQVEKSVPTTALDSTSFCAQHVLITVLPPQPVLEMTGVPVTGGPPMLMPKTVYY